MSNRHVFLGRLRSALAGPDYEPRIPLAPVDADRPRPRYVGRPAGVDAFVAAWEKLGGSVHHARGDQAMAQAVEAAVDGRGPVLVGAEPLVDSLTGDLRWPDCGLAQATKAQVAVVGARAAAAATGTLLVDAAFGRGRSSSLLPPVGVFVLRADTIRDTPSDLLRNHDELYPDGPPSQVVLVTGPSRTADIEMSLTVGVHGPGEVHAVIIHPEDE